ncbi:hypothetical protein DL95DRAFT_391240 [Leptodontidium sp. 2 PMI_412]|nr:hypothetical protein BKA61DRAFT_619667 [Leptodontidium sp. MPI-SDFR-AT-0119]KAH9212737.1 hypothetical protein DL95DRAFT_391240 [Leptodontidium sp. 2 PMI_412]
MDFLLDLQPKAGQLRPQHNPPGESSTRENALEYDPDDKTLVNVRIDTVQYGLHSGNPAALIILRFIFKFRPASKRIRNFHINIEFRKHSESGETTSHPKVIKLAPEELRGKIFTEERSNTLTAGGELPLGPTGATLHIDEEMARKINREYELKLSGWKKSSEVATDNVVIWDCTEAKKAAKGVVPGYRGAIIVQYPKDQPFSATMRLDAERGTFNFDKNVFEYLNIFGKKEIDDPVFFHPDKPFGHQYQNLGDFEDINLEDYIKLEPIKTLPVGYS